MFKKILIANRGEIACRIIRTCREMGISTVAIYAEPDADSLHVQMADEAVLIGPAEAKQSYLNIRKVVAAARKTKAEAVHPGFGFLAENTEFAKALEKAKITFIGPGPKAIAAMGDKIESKKLAKKAGVDTVPGYVGVIKNADEALRIAADIGYPVMIKASAGGGGKGMRIARTDEEVREGFVSAANEARASFGDERVFIEKFIDQPRHIEIQVLADQSGNTIHLGERECSIQRRHQKVIEEAPSMAVDARLRQRMGAQAIALAKAVNYVSAGTVEFIMGPDKDFYFLEMNTRLQVEHPVTEFVTGVDIVEEMIRIAAGEKLRHRQSDVSFTGWAMESRVYAEDPTRNFLPSIGRLSHYIPPNGDNVRVDTGVSEGSEISMFYDPMIAKLVTYGATRKEAIKVMRRALDEYYIRGVDHNLGFLASVFANKRFVAGRLTTNFIAEEYPDGFSAADVVPDDARAIPAVAAVVRLIQAERERTISGQSDKILPIPADWVVFDNGNEVPLSIQRLDARSFEISVGGETLRLVTDWHIWEPIFRARLNRGDFSAQLDLAGIRTRITVQGRAAETLTIPANMAEAYRLMPEKVPPDMTRFLLSPMPGLLASLAVEEGQAVKVGEVLAVIEAMKMENVLRAERDGVISEIKARPGENLMVDQPILEFD
ncbi:MAG: acetyl-CoA carboxylase biotin carboxylase subunit [Alphaproteobacteria bacterium]